jgi:hypothetical protein
MLVAPGGLSCRQLHPVKLKPAAGVVGIALRVGIATTVRLDALRVNGVGAPSLVSAPAVEVVT